MGFDSGALATDDVQDPCAHLHSRQEGVSVPSVTSSLELGLESKVLVD